MQRYVVQNRPGLKKGVKTILLVNVVIYLVELGYAYAIDFDPARLTDTIHLFTISTQDVLHGRVWQIVTHMWLHSPDAITHIVFNMLVLFFFGPTLEARWGTKLFVRNYFLFGFGGAVFLIGSGLIWSLLFGHGRPPALGASGAISGLVASYCIIHWRSHLRLLIFNMNGMWMLIIFVFIDLLRVLAGEPIAIEAHWGGMVFAAALFRSDLFSPRLLGLRLKRWRLRRRLRLVPRRKNRNDKTYLN